MDRVRIKKEGLLSIMKKNREEHRGIFIEAQKKYREVVIQELDEQLAAAREGSPFVLCKITQIIEPKDYTSHYDTAIKMLEMSIDETVEITTHEFNCFVDDVWEWSHEWAFSNSLYSTSDKVRRML